MSRGAGPSRRAGRPIDPLALIVVIALLVAAPLACGKGGAPEVVTGEARRRPRVSVADGWLAMGTFFDADLRVASQDVARARDWLEWARVEIARLEAIYSRHDPSSQLSALNRVLSSDRGSIAQEGREGVVPIGVELAALLGHALAISRATEGAFDITIGPLVELWSRAAAVDRWPGRQALERATARVGSGQLALRRIGEAYSLHAKKPGLRLDLDALSKGSVLDRLRASLAGRLPEAAGLLSFGESSVWAIGDPDGGGWRLEIRSRDPARGSLGTLRLRDRALSVSSSVGNVSEIGGRRVSHVIDPRSGLPVEGSVEAIVVSTEAAAADAWSTALLVLASGSGGEGLRRLESEGLEAWVVGASGRSQSTSGWARWTADPAL